jgi:L-alanine-DL-glutamate epimerase-like enolase superfamily enzyme
VPWREKLVNGWHPLQNGAFALSERPGLGIELNEAEIAAHPYVRNPFPSLWDERWAANFNQS